MNKLILAVVVALSGGPALAGSVAGTGGATEVTQILNMVKLAASYEQQVMSYMNQLLQYDTMLKNLKSNPLGVLAPDLAKATNDATRLWATGKNIAGSMSQVDKSFADTFRSPVALKFSDQFSNWSNTSLDSLKSAMLNAGLQRENFKSDGEALQKLVESVSAADGAVGGLQALGSLNAAQVQESMKLRDLISQQQVAQNTYLAAQTSKEQAKQTASDKLAEPYTKPIPRLSGEKLIPIQW